MSNDYASAMRSSAAALVAVLAFAAAAESTPEPHLRSFGPFGVARGQVARLSVANATIGNPDVRPACEVDLVFLDPHGRTVTRVRKIVAAGTSAFLDVEFSPPPEPEAGATVIRFTSRQTLRALVLVQPPPEPDAPVATCVTTLERVRRGHGPDASHAGRS